MAVLPESMKRLDLENIGESLTTIEGYIRYMGERIEFAVRNVTRTANEAGVSSAELYLALTDLGNRFSALESAVNSLSGSVTAAQGRLVRLEGAVTGLQTQAGQTGSAVKALEETVEALERRVGALERRVGALEDKNDPTEE